MQWSNSIADTADQKQKVDSIIKTMACNNSLWIDLTGEGKKNKPNMIWSKFCSRYLKLEQTWKL